MRPRLSAAIDDPLEDDIQIAIVDYLTLLAPTRGFLFFHVPNQALGKALTRGGLGRMARLKRMGLLPGVADLVIDIRGRAHYLEVKRKKGRPSESQLEFRRRAEVNGSPYEVAHSFDEAVKILQKWGIAP